jgi:transcriptional regulator with XRE-family HTH domain
MINLQNRTTLAQNLIKLRKKYGLTQEDLSKLSDVSRRTIALYETKTAKPPLENIEKLATALNVKIDKLIGPLKPGDKLNDDFSAIDSRTLKKFKQILSLPPAQRHMIYSLVDSLTSKNNTKAS